MRHDKTPAFESFDHTQKKLARMLRHAFSHRSMNEKRLDVRRFYRAGVSAGNCAGVDAIPARQQRDDAIR
jgi:hypothetical protein